ncbi:MAG: ABC-type uncharacterized transport system substrate-binding protein [Porticoccaceae bacterium]|jgi:ABC-type uncharacterized transport system substrate-binding protein
MPDIAANTQKTAVIANDTSQAAKGRKLANGILQFDDGSIETGLQAVELTAQKENSKTLAKTLYPRL